MDKRQTIHERIGKYTKNIQIESYKKPGWPITYKNISLYF